MSSHRPATNYAARAPEKQATSTASTRRSRRAKHAEVSTGGADRQSTVEQKSEAGSEDLIPKALMECWWNVGKLLFDHGARGSLTGILKERSTDDGESRLVGMSCRGEHTRQS